MYTSNYVFEADAVKRRAASVVYGPRRSIRR